MNPQNDNMLNNEPSMSRSHTKNKVLILIGAIAVVLIITVGIFMLTMGNNKNTTVIGNNGKKIEIANTPIAIQSQFMSAIFNNNNKGAYDLTSKNFMANTDYDSFIKSIKFLNVDKLSVSAAKTTTNNNSTIVSGEIVSNGVHVFNYASRMIQYNGHWAVDNFSANP